MNPSPAKPARNIIDSKKENDELQNEKLPNVVMEHILEFHTKRFQ